MFEKICILIPCFMYSKREVNIKATSMTTDMILEAVL